MPLPIIANVIRCTASGRVEGGGAWSNTYHYKIDPTDTITNAISKIGAELGVLHQQQGYGAGFYGWAQYNTDGTTFDQVVATPLDGTSASQTLSYTQAGVSSQNPLPGQTCMAVTLRTLQRGRSHRGRVFWTCTSRETIDGSGHVALADVLGTDSAFNAHIGALAALAKPIKLVVASYKLGTTTDVVGAVARQVLAHQTHRRGRGA